jgi:hypothetical protein
MHGMMPPVMVVMLASRHLDPLGLTRRGSFDGLKTSIVLGKLYCFAPLDTAENMQNDSLSDNVMAVSSNNPRSRDTPGYTTSSALLTCRL